MTYTARSLRSMRHWLSRALRPLLGRHDGRFFLYRRAILASVERVPRDRPPLGYEVVTIEEAAALVAGARVHRPKPGLAVLDIPGGVVMGERGHVGIDPTHIIAELGPGWLSDAEILRECEAAAVGPVVDLPGTTANLAAVASQNYSHWLLQGCTRLQLLELTAAAASCDRFLVSRDPPPFLLETLERCGVTTARILVATTSPTVYRCEHLLAPGMPRAVTETPRWALDGLRERFGDTPSPNAPARVYIGRGSARRRKVLNENAVVELVATHGFEVVAMDGRTIAEQAALLSRAECIVGPHGAALTNFVFAPPGTTIIELANKNWPHPVFRHIAATMGFTYFAVQGLEQATPRWLGSPWMIDADIVVDTQRLARTLDLALIGSGIGRPLARNPLSPGRSHDAQIARSRAVIPRLRAGFVVQAGSRRRFNACSISGSAASPRSCDHRS